MTDCYVCEEEIADSEHQNEVNDRDYNTHIVCDSCCDDGNGLFSCNDCGDNFVGEPNAVMVGRSWGHRTTIDLCSDCFGNYFTCSECNATLHEDSGMWSESYGETVCDDCFHSCCNCGADMCESYDDDGYCSDCSQESHEPEPLYQCYVCKKHNRFLDQISERFVCACNVKYPHLVLGFMNKDKTNA